MPRGLEAARLTPPDERPPPMGAAETAALLPPATPGARGARRAEPFPSSGGSSTLPTPRSAKRKAAEAALSRRFEGGGRTPPSALPLPLPTTPAAAAAAAGPPARRAITHTTIPPCGPPSTWCGLGPVVIPRWAWKALAGGRVRVVENGGGGEGGSALADHPSPPLTVSIVEDPAALPAALSTLRSTMQDRLVAIDLEWTPDGRGQGRWRGRGGKKGRRGGGPPRPSPISLVQLATATHALLIRVCCFPQGPSLHPALAEFLADPAVTIVGFAWESGDEAKAAGTWGVGRGGGLFGELAEAVLPTRPALFVDAQAVARDLGYAALGLGSLAARVLGVSLPKPAALARSAWGNAAARLSADQVRYAALDALAAGHLLRGLRLLHHGARRGDAPGACPGCAVPVGAAAPGHPPCGAVAAGPPAVACGGCGVEFADARSLADHARATGHEVHAGPCEGCGRWGMGVEKKRMRKVGR